jgi:hypothetical protein
MGNLVTADESVAHPEGRPYDSDMVANIGAGAERSTAIVVFPRLARARPEPARMLLARCQGSLAEQGGELLDQGLAAARVYGLANIERRAVALLQ